jgi:hypothetical protein
MFLDSMARDVGIDISVISNKCGNSDANVELPDIPRIGVDLL